jgi:UDP-N-acetylglucosamine 2-epimerase
MKIVSVVGARPQIIKAASVSKALRKEHHEMLIHTGQHYDFELSQLFFDELKIPEPDYNLGVGSASHGEQTGEMLKRIEEVLLKENPDFLLVYGDTNSTLAGALAAVKLHIPLGHVEAGLRSFDKSMPEEVNRVLTDYCSTLLFAPTKTAVENLKKEGITDGVYFTGDVMYDALLECVDSSNSSKILEQLDLKPKKYLLATIHRPSNTDNPINLKNILEAFSEVKETIVFPVHPRTEKFIKEQSLDNKIKDNVILMKPLGHFYFVCLEKNAKTILTDSGGVQREAYWLKVPCITLRDTTEWVETVKDGWNVLAGTDKEKILEMVNGFEPEGKQNDVFGDGKASERICEILQNHTEKKSKISEVGLSE